MNEALIMQQVTDLQDTVLFLEHVLTIVTVISGIGIALALFAISKLARGIAEIEGDLSEVEADLEGINAWIKTEDMKKALEDNK